MSTIALPLNDTVLTACGVDLLDGLVVGLGCGAAVAIEGAASGGNTLIAEFAMSGADSAACDAMAATGMDGDGAALLVGAGAVDTLGQDVVLTGRDAAFGDAAPATTGINVIWTSTPAPAPVCDLSVSLVLHRLAMFSALAPAAVGFHTGLAR